ncbi:MAG TPA: rhodanese-like domain-containing protein [Terriglobales bacterium]
MRFHSYSRALTVLIVLSALPSLPLACAADNAAMKTLTPDELVRILAAPKTAKPLLFHVGSHIFYLQAHIPGSEYLGAGATAEGIQNLQRRVSGVPKKTSIVLYCGCCPWSHCPNVNPAYDALLQMGFTNVKVLFLANNFGADWVDKGYPVAKGE